MRAISSLVLFAALAGCTAVDDFGKFTVGPSVDMAGGGCVPGCDCIAADPVLGFPDHCRLPPLNGYSCPAGTHPTVTLAAGTYQLDTGAQPPVLTDTGGKAVMSGMQMNNVAQFCVGSLVGDAGVHIVVVNDLPIVIIADSIVRMSNSSWALGGGYASDMNGAAGFAGGTSGGSAANQGQGNGGGKGGNGSPGTGGGGGASVNGGATGGAAVGGVVTPGGMAQTMLLAGFGGGGGGKGSVFGGGGGGGGGALQLSASWSVALSSVVVDASGGGGAGGGAMGTTAGFAGGGGGGGGGGILILDAANVSTTGGCYSVIGGPGGAGGAATRGGDAHAAVGCGFIGTPGIAPPNGGPGGTPGAAGMAAGGPGTLSGGGGGGIGGAGRVIVRAHTPPMGSDAPNVIPMSAYVPMTLP